MKPKRVVVIIGGGFAGSITAKKLEKDFRVILIDKKDFFEFTPGVLRAIVEPHHLQKLHVYHKDYLKRAEVIKSEVTQLHKDYVALKNEKKVYFDYLVLASGSSYHPPIKAHNLVSASNTSLINEDHKKLKEAKNVLVVGGGIVGVELAAEIAEKFCNDMSSGKKKITLGHSQKRLMPRESEKAINYAEKFLEQCGVNIIFEKRFSEKDVDSYDMVFLATGIKPNTKYLPKKYLDEKGFIKVKKTFHVEVTKNIFAAGDAANIVEEKLAQAAEAHAHTVAHNILAQEQKAQLTDYNSTQKLKIISLGKYKGIITYKGYTFTGYLPGVLKNILEWYYMKTLKL